MQGLFRRLLAELLGTALLLVVVVGSGIAAQRLSPNDVGLELLENALATGAGLAAIILALGSVSGAHLNPLVSVVDTAFGGLPWRELPGYIAAQLAGAAVGCMVANAMFALPAVSLSTHDRFAGNLWLSEVVATVGLLLVIFGTVRTGKATTTPFALGAYITGAYFFTSSTSFANPAVTVGRTLSNTFAGISPRSVLPFVLAQVGGAAVAWAAIRTLYPDMSATADAVLIPHGHDGGAATPYVSEVLFVCVHNAGRSQMAAALLDHHAQGAVHVRSAGSEPADQLNPAVVAAMAEVGIDITKEFPKPLTDEVIQDADVVITMGCGDACPLYPGKRYLDWQLEDPAGKDIETVRRIRDGIGDRVRALLTELASRRPKV